MLCEVIALGCLVAHGDIKASHQPKLQREDFPGKILKQLEELHNEFYPQPITFKQTGPMSATWTVVKDGFLAQAELPRLYGKCGDALHRGNLKKLLKPRMPVRQSYPEIWRWAERINELLKEHRISLIDGKAAVICQLGKPDAKVRVAWAA